MVQIIQPSPRAMQVGQVGQAIGGGLSSKLGLMEAENAFQQAGNDPVKLATAMARLNMAAPGLQRSTGQIYEALLRNMQKGAISRAAGDEGQNVNGLSPEQEQNVPLSRGYEKPQEQLVSREPIPLRETTPGIQSEGPLGEKMMPKAFWSPQQRMGRAKFYMDMGFLPDQAMGYALEDEKRYMANPEIEEKRYQKLEERKVDARNELTRQLETKTQKKGDELFADVPGEYLIGAEKGMERDLRSNPNMTISQAADNWSTKALDTAKAKSQFEKFSQSEGVENIIKGDTGLKKLESYGDIFRKSGNEEQYFNLLKDKMKLSPQGAASIAYKLRPSIDNIVKKTIVSAPPKAIFDRGQNARSVANKVSEVITPQDSLLAISWKARQKDPAFDERAFFDQMSKNTENLSPLQQREIAEGASGFIPYWGDILIFPWLGE